MLTARTGTDSTKVKWVDALKNNGVRRSRPVAKEYRHGTKTEGLAHCSNTTAGARQVDHVAGGDSSFGPSCVVWRGEVR